MLGGEKPSSVNTNLGPPPRFGGAGLGPPGPPGQPNMKPTWYSDFILFSPIEMPDDFDKRLHRAHTHVNQIFSGRSQSQIHSDLANPQDDPHFLSLGLIVCILKDPKNWKRYYHEILYFNHAKAVSGNLQKLISEKWHKLVKPIKDNLIQLLKCLMSVQFIEIENVFYCLFRSLGHDSDRDSGLYFIEKTVDVFLEIPLDAPNLNYQLLSYALFRFLRFLYDQGIFHKANIDILRRKELKFCVSLLQAKFGEFIFVGRDLIRLIFHLSTCPMYSEFIGIFKTIIMTPSKLTPKLPSIVPMLKTRTSKDYFRLLITYQLERKIKFLTNNVEFGQQQHYQNFLLRQYFGSPQLSQLLRGDIIRYICTSIRPSPEVSKCVPRWAFVGWIISNLQDPYPAAIYSKVALYYDFLFTENSGGDIDILQDMEPGLSVIQGSTRDYTEIAVYALQFLLRLPHYFTSATPTLTEYCKSCCVNSVRELDKKFFDFQMIKNTFLPLSSHLRFPPDAKLLLEEYLLPENSISSLPSMSIMDSSIKRTLPLTTTIPTAATNDMMSREGNADEPVGFEIGISDLLSNDCTPSSSLSSARNTSNTSVDSLNSVSNLGQTDEECSTFTISKLVYDNDISSCTLLPVEFASGSVQTLQSAYNPTNNSSVSETEPNSDNAANFSDDEEDDFPSPKKKIKKNHTALPNGQNEPEIVSHSSKKEFPVEVELKNITPINKFNNGGLIRQNSHQNGNDAPVVKPIVNSATTNHSNSKELSTFLSGKNSVSKDELPRLIGKLSNENLRTSFKNLGLVKNTPVKCKETEKISKIILKDGFSSSDLSSLVQLFLNLFEEDFDKKIFPNNSRVEINQLRDSLKFPVFVLFQELVKDKTFDNRDHVLQILSEIEKSNSKFRYNLLYFLSAQNAIAELEEAKPNKSLTSMKIYEEYIDKLNLDISDALFDDLKCCMFDDPDMLFFMLPKIYKHLGDSLMENGPKLMDLIVKMGDQNHVYEIVNRILRNELKIIDEDQLAQVFEKFSLLDTNHQNVCWQIIRAHNFNSKNFIFLLEKFDINENSNFFSNLLTLFSNEIPTDDLLNSILGIKQKSLRDDFFVSVFVCWSENYPDKLASVAVNFVNSKRNKAQQRDQMVKILKFFDKVIKITKKLKDPVVAALFEFVQSTPNLPKNEFKDLLSIINEDEKTLSSSSQNSDEKKDKSNKKVTGSPKRIGNKKRAAATAASSGSNSSNVEEKKRKADKDSD